MSNRAHIKGMPLQMNENKTNNRGPTVVGGQISGACSQKTARHLCVRVSKIHLSKRDFVSAQIKGKTL
jgi:hypothetical protein